MTRIAILIPCYNEAATIGAVVDDFRGHCPEAAVHVFDNASTDASAEIARGRGAIVHPVPVRGKGAVVRSMFRDVDADVYVMVDGDSTYPADRVRTLVGPVEQGEAEMVVGTRLHEYQPSSFRPLHVFGNELVLRTINMFFRSSLTDVMSGYRAFSRRFVKTMPVLSHGFEIETEMTLHALEYRLHIVEVRVPYGERPEGSESKLHTYRDGARVLRTIFNLYKHYRPMAFFGTLGLVLLAFGVVAGVAVVVEFMEYRQVVGVARAVLAVASGIAGVLSIMTGLILDTVNRRARELYLLLADQIVGR